MKIRNGFVTNSSSSSFIVAFHNKEEMLQIPLKYRERIMEDILNPENKITVEQAVDYFEECCYYSIYSDVQDNIREEMGYDYDRYEEWLKWKEKHKSEIEARVEIEMNKQKQELRNFIQDKDILSMISYSDDESDEESELEMYCYDMEGCYAVLSFH